MARSSARRPERMPAHVAAVPPFTEERGAVTRSLAGTKLDWLRALRTRGLARYEADGLPTRKTEAWRYTNLNRLTEAGYVPAELAPTPAVDGVPLSVPVLDGYTVVLVNGRMRADLSRLADLPRGVRVAGLADVIEHDPAAVQPHLGSASALEGMPLAALNTAYLADGLFVHAAAGVVLDRPVHVISVGAGGAPAVVFHPRHLVVLEAGAVATVVETHVGSGAYFANSVAELIIGEGAALSHCKLQDEAPAAVNLSATFVDLAPRAGYDAFTLQLGAALARQEVRAHLGGREADVRLAGVTLATDGQHMDTTTLVDHAAPAGRSRQTFKVVLDGAARGVFQGKVLVRPAAQKTDAHQLNRNLLLSPRAEVDAKPELEIYADDVKCSHGAATGTLDDDALFYLMSRGIHADAARRMLVEAFLTDVLDGIGPVAVREAYTGVLQARLGGIGPTAVAQ